MKTVYIKLTQEKDNINKEILQVSQDLISMTEKGEEMLSDRNKVQTKLQIEKEKFDQQQITDFIVGIKNLIHFQDE